MSRDPIDRTRWPAGPWDREPDHAEWESHGLRVELSRMSNGCWCATILLPPAHPLHGIAGEQLHCLPFARDDEGEDRTPEDLGLPWPTVDGEARDGSWYIGWDYAHSWHARPTDRDCGDGSRYIGEREARSDVGLFASAIGKIAKAGRGHDAARLASAQTYLRRAASAGASDYSRAQQWLDMRRLALAIGVKP